MRNIVDDLAGLGAKLVAITPQTAEHSRKLIEKHNLNFEMLSDPGNDYAAELGLRFYIGDDVREIYEGFGLNLPANNGDDSWTLPMPARLVIDSAGIVRATDIDPNYTARPEPQKTIDDVRALG